jgi:Protein of unknown function (DUF2845)
MKAWLPLLLLALAATAPADAAFRCGTKLVTEGDTRAEVLAKCGDPVDVERRTVLRQPYVYRHGRPLRVYTDVIEIPIEIWIYNLGPSKLMRRIHFEDGRVVEIETLDYGYHEKPRRPPPREDDPRYEDEY